MKKIQTLITYKNGTLTMNRNIRFVITSLLLLIFLACITNVASAQQQDESVIAVVLRINGALEIRKSETDNWVPARVSQDLYNGNQLRTGIGNKAIILYTASGTRVLVNENTEFEIMAQAPPGKFQKPTTERTKLLIGEIYSRLKEETDPSYTYEVETPSSVASVRGCEFDSQYANGIATFLVMLDAVEVMNQLGAVLLEQYQRTTVPDGQVPGEAETLSKSEAEKAIDWLEEVDPLWRLNMIPQGGTNQEIGVPFLLTIMALSTETGSPDINASFVLTSLITDSEVLEFSTDNGKTWGGAPNVFLANGQAVLMVRCNTEGTANITIGAEDSEPSSLSLVFATPKEKKTIQMNFANPDGTGEKNLIIEIEEK